ncbi:MAG: GtrA family protein, partial [Candidatus Staskawiczbacteria bacterium]|nr:GtrA family protein [Candidatus Staskawiczbacteria bacterium]
AKEGSKILKPQPFLRKILGKAYSPMAKAIVGLKGIEDTQCGFKLFRANVVEDIIQKCKINRWSFDVEILLLAQKAGYKIKEMPVSWSNDSDTKVKFLGMVKSVLELIVVRINNDKKGVKQFIKYFIIGCSAVILDLATLYIFKSFLGWSAVFSVVINQLLITNYVFLLNKFWTFKDKNQFSGQILKFYSLALLNYIIAIAWMWFFHNFLGQNYLLVRTCNIALSVIWNFLLYKFFIYI